MMNEWIISSSVLIAAVLLGRFALRGKISLRLQYALWAVVLLRLLLPIQIFTSDFGTGSIARDVDISAPVRQVYVSVNEERYAREYDAAYRQVEAEYEAAGRDPVTAAPVDPIVIEETARERAQTSLELNLSRILYHIWLTGMAVMAAVIISCNVHLSVQLKRRRWALEIPESLLSVYVTEAVPTPCVFGFFRPAIYLTPEAAKDPQVRAHVLEHELTHYRHFDHVWSVLRSLCLVLHWYNPLVWIAAKVSRADAELACDEGALTRLGEDQRGDYGRTLIGLTCQAPISELLITATTMTGSAGSIRERIRLLMKRPRNTVLTVTTVILLVTLIVGCTFAGAPETTQQPETTGPDEDYHWSQTDLTYALPMEQAMADYAGKNPRKLTSEELARVNEAFASTVYDAEKDEYSATAVVAFFTSDYDDVRKLDLAEFLRYFPVTAEATEEEFQLLREKYGDDFDWAEHESLQNMPVPVHSYAVGDIDAALQRYANISFRELEDKDSVYYLEETDSYYNFTSDFGPGMFHCVNGFVYDGGAILYSESMALFLTESAGQYSITAHISQINDRGERAVTADDSFTADGLLVYPGTEWGMTENELLRALNIMEYGVFSGMRGIHLPTATFCGYSADIAFYFEQYDSDHEWGLTGVRVSFADAEAANAVCSILSEQLGDSDLQTSGGTSFVWHSDVKLKDLVSPEAYAAWQNEHTVSLYEGQDEDLAAASAIACFGAGDPEMENTVIFSSDLHLARQIEAAVADDLDAQIRALYAEDGDRWYRAALAAPFSGGWEDFDAEAFFSAGQTAVELTEAEKAVVTAAYGEEALEHTVFRMRSEQAYQVIESYIFADGGVMNYTSFLFCPETDSYLLVREEVPQLRVPEILSCEKLASNKVRMIYRFPGEDQWYAAVLVRGETWQVDSNLMILEKPQDARTLTAEEIQRVKDAFSPDAPLSCFLLDKYQDISQMSRARFLSYYPTEEYGQATEEEFQLLAAKYPVYWEGAQSLSDVNWPLTPIRAGEVRELMETYTRIEWEDLPGEELTQYLEETDSYYVGYSDVGLFGFPCTGGWVYDGGAMLCSEDSVLILTEQKGTYYIQSYLPAVIAQ